MIDGLTFYGAMMQPVFAWLLTYLLHSTLLLGGVWLAIRFVPSLRTAAAEDALWTITLVGGLLSATVQGVTGLGLGVQPPTQRTTELPSSTTTQHTAPADLPPTSPSPSSDMEGAEASVAPSPATSTHEDEPSESSSVSPAATRAQPTTDATSTAAPTPATVPMRAYLALGIVIVWLAGALVMLLRRFGATHRFLRRISPRRPIEDPDLRAFADAVRARMAGRYRGAPDLRLTVSEAVHSPVALGRAEICLPARALDTLKPTALQSMIAHEYAHLLRRDPQWRVALAIVESLFWLQPLNSAPLPSERMCLA